MYKYCMQCGALLELGVCPNCDAQKLLEKKESGITEDLSKIPQKQTPVESVAEIVEEPVTAAPKTVAITPKPVVTPKNSAVKPSVQPANVVAKPAPTRKTHPAVIALLCFCMCIFLLIGLFLLSVRNFMTEDNLVEVSKDIKFSDFVEFVDDAELVEITYEDGNKYSFSEGFYQNLQLMIRNNRNVNVDAKQLGKMLDKTELMELLGEKGADYFSDIVNNDEEFSLTEYEVRDVLYKDRYAIEAVVGYTDSEFYSLMAKVIVQENLVEKMSPENLKDENTEVYNTVQLLFSWFVIISILVLTTLPIAYMVRKDAIRAAKNCGIIFTAIGGLFTFGALLALMLPRIWEIILGNGFLGAIVGGYLVNSLPLYGCILLIGIGAIVARGIMLRKRG